MVSSMAMRPQRPAGGWPRRRIERPGPVSTNEAVRMATVRAMARQCSRPTCSEAAEATLVYDYAESFVWVLPLSAERDPHAYDLCRRHADRVRVPQGWSCDDHRRMPITALAS